jgi:hypothetical protein
MGRHWSIWGVKDDLGSHLLLYQELKKANLSARDAIEGIKYARRMEQIKFEYNVLLNDMGRVKQETNSVLYELEALKREKILLEITSKY